MRHGGMTAILFALLVGVATGAAASERLLVCGPCSREFIPTAERVVRELRLDVQVDVGPMPCVGYCDRPFVIAFRDQIYVGMDESRLRSMLEETAAPAQ